MRIIVLFLFVCAAQSVFAVCQSNLLDHRFRKLAGTEEVNLCDTYAGKVLLVVNTASKCGYTPQYDGLEKLHEKYEKSGFSVLGFPSNDFMGQEPGTEAQIQDFCRLTYGVQFPMFEKVTVKSEQANAFFKHLAEVSGTYPTWNFHKFLIGRDGKFIKQFSPHTTPADPDMINAIEKAIQ
ncbi:MAG: glutathione peroxidase [Nitrosomonas sp.]|jgi:glutathione peroxidase|nr:glutathione peroxidase [Nitrosomonas sp.]MBK7365749.1 glutathione peroxidase [Nitrosomonas sp.]